MGMFTKIRHPITGAEIQIKTGFDDCMWYSVGDSIDWSPNEYWPGYHIDGAHSGFMDTDGDVWVVIKDCVVQAVHEVKDLESGDVDGGTYLYGLYGIEPPDSTLWSDEAWERARVRQEASEKKWKAIEEEADAKGLKGFARMAFLMAVPLRERRGFTSFGQKVFKVEPLT